MLYKNSKEILFGPSFCVISLCCGSFDEFLLPRLFSRLFLNTYLSHTAIFSSHFEHEILLFTAHIYYLF